jgi:hypothetical protein
MLFQGWDQVWQAVLSAIIPVVLGVILMLSKRLFDFLATKTGSIKDNQLRSGLYTAEDEAQHLTEMIINSLNQTLVGGLKAQNGNALSPADSYRIKSDALSKIKSLLSTESTNILVDHRSDLDAFLSHLLESTIFKNKQNSIAFTQAISDPSKDQPATSSDQTVPDPNA